MLFTSVAYFLVIKYFFKNLSSILKFYYDPTNKYI